MPLSTVLVLIAVVAMFALFAVILAWAQFQTSGLTIGSTAIQTIGHPKRRPF